MHNRPPFVTSAEAITVVAEPMAGHAWDAPELSTLTSILGRKWTVLLVTTLYDGPLRHNVLARRLSGTTRKVLHDSLNGLIADGIVERILGIDELGGSSTSYGLTELGRSLAPVFDAAQIWCAVHLDELHDCRAGGGAEARVDRAGAAEAVTFG